MGLNYAAYLYIPVARIDALLQALARVTDEPDRARVLGTIPYSPARVHTFTSRYRSEPGQIKFGIRGLCDGELDSQHIYGPLSLLVPIDQAITKFLAFNRAPLKKFGTQSYASLGYDFGAVAGDKYAQVILSAPTSDLSCLLVESPSMSELLKELVRASDGLGGLIDLETGYLRLLDDSSRRTQNDWYEFEAEGDDDVEGSPDVDYYVESLIARGALLVPTLSKVSL